MPFDQELAQRVRAILGVKAKEIRMFGGLCFTLRGNMCCGVLKDDLVLRVDPARHAELLEKPYARPMDFTKRPMKGFLFVGPGGTRTAKDLKIWIQRGFEYASSLPPKAKKA